MAKRKTTGIVARHGAVRWVLFAGLLAMLLAGASYFTEHPGLTVHSGGPGQAAEAASPAGGAGGAPAAADAGVMALMQKLQANPQDVEALTALAQHFLHTDEAQKAENFAMRAVMAAQGADAAGPLYLLGVSQHNQGRYTEAAQSLEKSLQHRDDADTRFSLGIVSRYFLKDEARGLAELRKAVETPGASDSLKAHVAAELEKKAPAAAPGP